MKKNTFFVSIFILITLAFVGYGYYYFFVATDLPPVTQQPELTLVGSHEVLNLGRTFLVSGNYAYVSAGPSIVEIVNISNPLKPVSVGLVGLSADTEEAVALYVFDNYLYVAGNASGIHIFNVSNAAKPERAGYYSISDPRSLVGIDNYLFVGTGHGLFILDISDPTNPVLVEKDSENFAIHDLFLTDNLIYIIGQNKLTEVSPGVLKLKFKDNIRVLDVSDRTNPVLVGKYEKQLDWLEKIYVYNGIAYITHSSTEKDGLAILDTSDLINFPLLGNYEFERVRSVYVFDKYAYVISNKKLIILDVSDPAKPALLKTVDKSFTNTISGTGKYIYLTCLSPERIPQFQIFEIR